MSSPLPKFENPPIVEVVFGITFRPLDDLLVPHFGLLWEKFRDEFPECREMAPLATVVEQFGENVTTEIHFIDTPPLPRVWFVGVDETGIIQVQRDRFLYNWKRVHKDQEYPGFHKVFAQFQKYLGWFRSFLEENNLGSLEPVQHELTYINHILKGDGWTRLDDVGKVFPDFVRGQNDRFLPEFESVNFRAGMVLPERSGRIHLTIRSAMRLRDSRPILSMELTARGIEPKSAENGMATWFDRSHEYITRGFVELTNEDLQKNNWRRKDDRTTEQE